MFWLLLIMLIALTNLRLARIQVTLYVVGPCKLCKTHARAVHIGSNLFTLIFPLGLREYQTGSSAWLLSSK